MADYVVMTDSNSELPLSIAKAYDVPFVRMPYTLDEKEYAYDLGEKTDFKAFFAAMRQGSMPTTQTYPPQHYVDLWRPILESGKDVLFIAFSSKLSAALQFATSAQAEIQEEFPQRRVVIVDTKNISAGMALLVYGALKRYKAGASLDNVVEWLTENIPKTNSYFTVDDLNHLKRGGRLPASTAMIGTMLQVKPILCVDDEGSLQPVDKARGRTKALHAMADRVVENAVDPEENACIILHADNEPDAQRLREMIESRVKFKEMYVQYIGPVIGTHAGPDTMGIGFMGSHKQ